MVGRYCTAGCRNSASECDGRAKFIKVPIEADQSDEWLRAVRPAGLSILHKNSAICERNFRENQIKTESALKDSFGNVIFQRPLFKFSLVKDIVPSIFHNNVEVTTAKKRKTYTVEQKDDPNTVANFSEDKVNVNLSSIIVSFHEDQTSSVQYITNDSQVLSTDTNGVAAISNFGVEGTRPIFSNNIYNGSLSGNSRIQINVNAQGFDKKAVNNVENNSKNKTAKSLNSLLVSKQQILHRIPNVETPKGAAITIPDDEVIYLSQFNNNNCLQQQKIITAVKRRKKSSTLQSPLQQSEKDINLRSFDLIYQNSDKIKLPNSMWGYHKNDKDNSIMVFSKVRWFSTNACTLPLYERQVVFHESNELKIYINNIFSPLESLRPRDIAEMEAVLLDVDKLSLCSGGPSIEFVQIAALAQKDHAVGRWRHKYCPIVVAIDENICKYCSSINQVFRYPKQKRLPFGRHPRAQVQK